MVCGFDQVRQSRSYTARSHQRCKIRVRARAPPGRMGGGGGRRAAAACRFRQSGAVAQTGR